MRILIVAVCLFGVALAQDSTNVVYAIATNAPSAKSAASVAAVLPVLSFSEINIPNIESAMKLKDRRVFGPVIVWIIRPKELTTGPYELVARPIGGHVGVVFLPCSESTALRARKGRELSIVGTVAKVNASYDGASSAPAGKSVAPNVGLVIETGWTGK